MNDGIETVQLLRVGKHTRAELLAIDATGGIQNFVSEGGEYFLVGRDAGFEEFVTDPIGLDDARTQILEESRYGAFAAGDASSKAEVRSEV